MRINKADLQNMLKTEKPIDEAVAEINAIKATAREVAIEYCVPADTVDRGGLLIAIEGIDGVGKATHLHKLYYRLLSDYPSTSVEAFYTPGPHVREHIENRDLHGIPALFAEMGETAEMHERCIKGQLAKKGVVLVANYFVKSTLLNAWRHREMAHVLHAYATENTWADITFILDCRVETAIERLISTERDAKSVGVNQEEDLFYVLDKRRSSFLAYAQQTEGMCLINTDQTLETAHETLWRMVEPLLASPKVCTERAGLRMSANYLDGTVSLQ